MLLIHNSKLAVLLMWVFFALGGAVAQAQDEGEAEGPPRDEFGFINYLLDSYGLTDVAQVALDKLKQAEPSKKEATDFLQARIRVKQGRTEEAEKIVAGFKAGNPKAQAVKLELAIYFHQVGEAEKSKKLFDAFFEVYKDKKPTDPDVLNAYINASFVLAEIRKNEGKWGEAIKYYKQLVTGSKEKKIRRIFMVETANAYVELAKATQDEKKKAEHLKSADKYARDAMWIYDETFGNAIVALVNVELAKGDRPKALELIKEYQSDINEIENQLRDQGAMALSPRCQLRYIKGNVYFADLKEAHAAGDTVKGKQLLQRAAVEYINAFLKYAGNDYSDRAGLRFNELDAWGVENGYPKLKAPKGTDGMIAGRLFTLAKTMLAQRKFKEAIPKYLEVLNAYPQTPASGEALGGLAKSFMETGDEISAMATAQYTAERFAGIENAGAAVRTVASFYFKADKKDLAAKACKLLGYNFPDDPFAPQLLYGAAELDRQNENNAEALKHYEFIVNAFPKDEYAVKAANRLGFASYDSADYDNAVKWFEKGVELSVPGPKKAEGWFRLANSYIKIGRLNDAIKQFSKLKRELDPNGPNKQLYYQKTGDKEKSTELLMQTSYFFAQSLTQLPDDQKGIEKLRDIAEKEFEDFIQKYPKSEYAPGALQKLGTLLLLKGEAEGAIAKFEEIPKKYPKYPGAKNIIYMIVDSAGSLGKKDLVATYTEKMMANAKDYSSGQLIRVGMRVLEFEQYELAARVMKTVAEHPDAKADPKIEQRALYGLGLAAFEQKDYAASQAALASLIEKYPKSANKLDAMFLQAACLRELEQCDEALAVLGDVTAQARDLRIKYPDRSEEFASAELKKEAELSLTNAKCGNIGGAINSVVLLLKTRTARTDEEKAIFKDMCLKGIDWCIEAEKWKVGEELCNIFTETWPLDKENFAIVRQKRSTISSNL